MWKLFEAQRRALVLVWVGLLGLGGLAGLAAQPAVPPGTEELAAELAATYEALPVRDGVVLRPLVEDAPFRALEILDAETGTELALDGEPVAENELRDRLGEAAEPILRLARLGPRGRRGVLGLEPPRPVAGPERAPEGRPAPPEETGLEESRPESRPERPPRSRLRTGDTVRLFGDVVIEEDEIAHEVVVIAGDLRVLGELRGGAVVVLGSAYVDGEVGRELTVVGGDVHLSSTSRVDGEINVIGGGDFSHEEGAVIDGRVNELASIGPLFGDGAFAFDFRPRFDGPFIWFRWVGGVVSRVLFLVVVALLGCLMVLFGPRLVDGVGDTLARDPWRSGAVGLLFQVLFFPLLILVVLVLVLSIIGIPLLIFLPFALLGLLVAAFLGYVGAARRVGQVVLEKARRPAAGPYLAVIVGVVAIGIWRLLSEVLDLPFLGWLSTLLLVFGVLVGYAAWTFGGGALLVYLVRRRQQGAGESSAAPQPPATSSPEAAADPPPAPPAPPEPGPAGEQGSERRKEGGSAEPKT